MDTFNKNISQQTIDFLQKNINLNNSLTEINRKIKTICGIVDFFETQEDIDYFNNKSLKLSDRDKKTEYGDYQTNTELAGKVCGLLSSKKLILI